ncbi:ABC-F family ATP-binding cassette domain-containing protein [Clostridium algidicarnis]|uniref:ABC-F family ATP-binding cassette domain-containing protein n=1 Tax=Clostridium algidicarnis TaxID=37659 RepID=A0ABS6C0M7_9CLOT|nr:ABC-F family ATP-binding cassette domain-containing protein [Clostridium algidicarnis]MBU3219021.1 ABC-F family ATP-binding cassette domain-containing protein [Clostridium algidicarnis]
MNLISLENISKSYSDKSLLDNISLGINQDEKIGLIGVNGSGKSTLLKIISGIEVPDEGNIIKGNKVRIEYLHQSPEFYSEARVIEQVFKGESSEMKLLRDYENTLKLLEKSKDQGDSYELNNKLIKLQSDIDSLNAWDLESEAKTILTKLGIEDFDAKVGTLSGGQKKRIALASALITPCELLILDEPTNHMDNKTIEWLEQYLNTRKGSLIMITHDRYFLDRVTNRILEIDKGKLYSYSGNYSIFLEKKIERQNMEISSENKREKLYEKELAWIKRGAKARSTKQKARIDRFEKLGEQSIDIKEDKMDISVLSSRLGKKIIEMENLNKSYKGISYIKDFSYILLREDRIGIVGDNGIGKSTLMKIISGEIKYDSGTLDIGETVKIGFFSQENKYMEEDMRVIEYMKEVAEYLPLADGGKITASQMLEKFLFTKDMQWTPISKLSGGEKRRLYLLRVLMGSPNILILDEPTNDLDISTLTILEDYLDKFDGAIITVSHDRYFLDRVCNKIFAFEAPGTISQHHGNYSDFMERMKESYIEESRTSKGINSKYKEYEDKKANNEKPLKFSFKEQKEFQEIDGYIESLEVKIEELNKQVEKVSTDFVKLQEVLNEKSLLEKELEEKYDRWTYLNELSEKIERDKKS